MLDFTPLRELQRIERDLERWLPAKSGGRRRVSRGAQIPAGWRDRLPLVYPRLFSKPFAPYHVEMWEWLETIKAGEGAASFIAIWPRDGGKSTNVEAAIIELGASARRNYAWYVRETQDQADKSVGNINALLESPQIEHYYPQMADRALSKFGKPRAWRRDRLTTRAGFTVDGLGLDTAVRGAKDVEQRPDLIVIDDIDGRHDSLAQSAKKIATITDSIIQAGSKDTIILFVQNMIIPDGVMAQLVDGRAGFMLDRIIAGPRQAAHNLTYEQIEDGTFKVTGGEPTWPEGYGLEVIQDKINRSGITSFLREAQHEVDKTGGLYDHIEFIHKDWDEMPDLVRVVVWVDPAVTSTDESDSMGIQADGLGEDGLLYRLFSWEAVTSPEDALRRAITKAVELGGTTVGVETDQGGDTWRTVFHKVLDDVKADTSGKGNANIVWPQFAQAKAGAGHGSKTERGLRMLADYERGKIVHVRGTHIVLERALRRFPNKPLDLGDAAFWSWLDLMAGQVEWSDAGAESVEDYKNRWQ